MTAIKHRFVNTLGNCRFTFKNGKDAIFLNGEYLTDVKAEIEELNAEVEAGHPHIRVDADKITVDSNQLDPMEAIRAKIREELIAEGKALRNGESNIPDSTSTQGPVVVGNTRTLGEAMSGSTSTDTGGSNTPATTAPVATQTGTTVVAAPVSRATIIPGPKSN